MDNTRYIIAGSCIDGWSGTVRKEIVLTLKDGRITAMGERSELPRDPGATVDDLSHCTIVPPLIDCSVALARSPAIDPRLRADMEQANPERQAALVNRHIGYCLAHGVLGVVDSNTPEALLARYRGTTAPEQALSICSAGCIGIEKGQGATPRTLGPPIHRIRYSNDIEQTGISEPNLGGDALRHLLAQSGSGRKVVVANGPQAVAEALAAGCDAIEQGYLMSEEHLRKMADNQVLWIPSVLRAKNGLDSSGSGGDVSCRFSLRYVAPGKAQPGAEASWKALLTDQLRLLGRARDLGVPTAVGTGAGSPGILHGESVVEEIKLFIKAGYSLAEAIGCASEQGARFFGLEQIGALRVGGPATFLVTRGTPHQLPRKLAYLEGIYVGGAPSPIYRKNPVKKGPGAPIL